MSKNNQIIFKEGYFKIAIALAIAIFLNLFICDFLSYIAFLITALIVYIYRDPNRHIYRNSKSILSPVDGKIEVIDYIDGKQKIYIKVSLCDSHKVISPVSGQLEIKECKHGLNLNPNSYKAKILNEQSIIRIDDLEITFISGKCNTQINFINNKIVEQGEELGVFLDGVVILTLKDRKKLKLQSGDKIKYGEEIS